MARSIIVEICLALCAASASASAAKPECNGQPDTEDCQKLLNACHNDAVADLCPATCGACPAKSVRTKNHAATKRTRTIRADKVPDGQVPHHLVPPECRRPESNGVTMTIKDEECYHNNHTRECGCVRSYSNYLSARKKKQSPAYMIPPIPEGRKPLTQEELENEVVFAFIHINKAGGSTIKNKLIETARENGIAVSHVGQHAGMQGWHTHRKNNWSRFESNYIIRPTFDGQITDVKQKGRPNRHRGRKATRFMVGGLSLGLCEIYCKIKGKCKCVYFTVLREPISRTISEYNYFCKNGAEKKKKWSKKEIRKGQCLRDLTSFMGSPTTTTSNFLVERASRACEDPYCGAAVSMANLRHPCMRYLLLERMDEGMHSLNKVFGKLFHTDAPLVHTNWNGMVKKPDLKGDELNKTKRLLVGDEIMYKQAEAEYEAQWDRPLYSCT